MVVATLGDHTRLPPILLIPACSSLCPAIRHDNCNLQEFKIIKRLGAGMESDGHELYIFRYILNPLFKNGLPKNSRLYELYSNTDQALAHLSFGLTMIDTVDPSPLERLFKSDTVLRITDGKVVYRKMLVDVARVLSSDAEKSKEFIQAVIASQKLEDCPSAKEFMPPQEKQETPNSFLPYIIKLFEEANGQCVIEPTDLTSLEDWLNACKFLKIIRDIVKTFNPDDTISKHCELVASNG